MAILEGAEPFLLPGGPQGVLLVHGFTGSPSEMRLLGFYLNERGYTVLAPRLSGHGSSVAEMAKTGWRQWYADVEDGYYLLKGLCEDISVIGLSMGGLLALKLAHQYSVNRVATLSSPIFIAEKRLPLLPLYRLFRQYAPKGRRRLDVEPIYTVNYDRTPLSSLSSLLDLITQIRRELPEIVCPLLVVQSKIENTVRPESAEYIYNHAGSSEKQLIWLNHSGHIITLDAEREQVFCAVHDFIRGGEK